MDQDTKTAFTIVLGMLYHISLMMEELAKATLNYEQRAALAGHAHDGRELALSFQKYMNMPKENEGDEN